MELQAKTFSRFEPNVGSLLLSWALVCSSDYPCYFTGIVTVELKTSVYFINVAHNFSNQVLKTISFLFLLSKPYVFLKT